MDPGIVPLSCRSTGSDALLLLVILQVEMAQVCLLEMVAGQQCLAQECQKVNGKKKSRATAWCNDGGSTSAVPPKNYSRTPQKATGPWCLCITVSQGGFKHVLLGLFVELNPRNRSVNQFRSSLTKQEGVYRGQTLNGNISRRDQSKVLTSCNHMNRMTNCPHSACQPDRPF